MILSIIVLTSLLLGLGLTIFFEHRAENKEIDKLFEKLQQEKCPFNKEIKMAECKRDCYGCPMGIDFPDIEEKGE